MTYHGNPFWGSNPGDPPFVNIPDHSIPAGDDIMWQGEQDSLVSPISLNDQHGNAAASNNYALPLLAGLMILVFLFIIFGDKISNAVWGF